MDFSNKEKAPDILRTQPREAAPNNSKQLLEMLQSSRMKGMIEIIEPNAVNADDDYDAEVERAKELALRKPEPVEVFGLVSFMNKIDRHVLIALFLREYNENSDHNDVLYSIMVSNPNTLLANVVTSELLNARRLSFTDLESMLECTQNEGDMAKAIRESIEKKMRKY